MKSKTITTALAAFLLSVPSQADLINLGNVTRDTDSGLDWLDATATAGMSYNDVSLQLGPGGAFEGYRYATLPELEGFLTAAGGTGPYLGSNQLPIDGWVTVLLDLWGITANQPGFNVYTSVLWGDSAISTQTESIYNPVTEEFEDVEVTAARVETGILQNFYGGGYATARFGVGQYDLRTVDYSGSQLGSALVQVVQVVDHTVTTLADNYTTPVAGSLRAAINLANADPGAATIVFNIAGGGTINLAASAGGDRMLPILTNPNGIAINGANGGQGAITIDGGLGDRIFFIGVAPSTPAAAGGNLPSTASTSFSLANLTLQNGQARGGNGGPSDNVGAGGGAGLGGAIFVNAGALSLTNVSLSGNRAVGGNGSAANDGVANGGGGGMGGAGGAGTDNNTRSGGGGGGLGNSAKGGTLAAAGGGGIFTGATGGGAGSDSGGAGGANGGGGGAGGINGNDDSGGGGGIGGQAGQAGNTGGAGGFGGGGGSYGQSGSGDGGAGGYGGGGGGGTWGGVGGFGGGGGGNMVESNNDTGGFGAGAGGYGPSFPDFGAGGGGGGLGAGGAIFLRQGATYSFAGCVFSGNTVAGGTGGAGSGFGNPGTPGENGSAIAPDVFGLSFTQDTDGDGMSDAAEFNMAALGFNWQVNQAALVETYFANANGNGLYTTSQIQALNVGTPLLQRNPGNGLFKLTIVVKKATDLINFNPFPMTAPQTTINAQGELEFQFSPPDNAAFFRLESR